VSQPDLVSSFWSTDNRLCSESEVALDDSCPKLPFEQIDHTAQLNQLAQSQILEQQRVARIYHLEQALDQALACLHDLRVQLQDQKVLEAQLATTEELAYVQQQAIARLRQQLAHQQQVLNAYVSEAQGRDQTVQNLLSTTEAMTQAQQAELEHLQTQIAQGWAKLQTHRSSLEQQIEDLKSAMDLRQQRVLELEAERLTAQTHNANLEVQLETVQKQIQDLHSALNLHQSRLHEMTAQLDQAQLALNKHQTIASSLRRTQTIASEQEATITSLRQNLTMTQIKVEELETQLAKQMRLQARWQQNCQEAEAERDRQKTRTIELTQRASEMQDQIFAQARQAGEYEAAVQHWKDRYLNSQRQITQLQELLEQAISQSGFPDTRLTSDALLELLTAIQSEVSSPKTAEVSLSPASRFSALDLPDFLVRHRSYRSR
jgi:chromosome segregation ATPase